MKSPSRNKVLDIHWPITIVSVAILLFMVGFLALRPDLTVGAINRIFNAAMSGLGPFMLLLDIFLIVICF